MSTAPHRRADWKWFLLVLVTEILRIHAASQTGLQELIVPVDQPSALVQVAEKVMKETLAGIRPAVEKKQQSTVLENGQSIVLGDLFKTGGAFALAEINGQFSEESNVYGFCLAEWTEDGWKLRGLWKIPTVWRPEGWKSGANDYLPVKPASMPFELLDLNGDGIPEVVVAGEVEKYYQEHYLLRFSPKTHTLNLLASAMGKPETVGEYVRLYFNSGRRAIFTEWQFLKWSEEQLLPVASWHDEVGYGTKDPTFSEGERFGEHGTTVVIRVKYGEGQEWEGDWQLTRDEKPFGRMRVIWKGEQVQSTTDPDAVEKGWLFEKITGLPRALYPRGNNEDTKVLPRLEDVASVAVENNKEGAAFFSFEKK